jgi:hypothetical protein
MSESLVLQELGIVIAMQQPNPSLVTEEFLKLSGIIPESWQLARAPIRTDRISQLLFTNGVSIVTEPNRIMFGERLDQHAPETPNITRVAREYLQIFKQANYQAIGINIRSYSPQPNRLIASQFINHQLLSDGSWQNYGIAPIQASLSVTYTLENRQLMLAINAAEIQFSEQEILPIVLFDGKFNYDLATSNSGANLVAATQVLDNWQQDLMSYRELISERYLGERQAIDPTHTPALVDNLNGLNIPYAPDLLPLVA